MEKLQRRSDGLYETQSGLLAIAPRAISGRRNGIAWFEFRASHFSDVIRVEWPEASPVIAIDADTARAMMKHNYAFNIDDAGMQAYNSAIDRYLADLEAKKAAEPPAPPPPPVEPSSTPAPPSAPDIPDAEAKGKKGK